MTDATLHETPVVPPTGTRPTPPASAAEPIDGAVRSTGRTVSLQPS